MGEGGGQVLRTALGLAARTGTPITVDRIRQARSEAGLRPQHVSACQAVAQACHGEVEGATVGSQRITMQPGEGFAQRVRVDPGTAANTMMILQALLPMAAGLDEHLTLHARGGTDTKWAPTLGFTQRVLRVQAARAGTRFEVIEAKEGFYPKGGGLLTARIHPSRKAAWPGVLEDRGELEGVQIIVRSSQLPEHVGERITSTLVDELSAVGTDAEAWVEAVEAPNPGVVVDAIATFEQTVLGANALGERGVPSETVARRCAMQLLDEISSPATVDVHTADQLVPLIMDQPGAGFFVRELTGHLETNIQVCQRFMDARAVVEDVRGGKRVRFEAR